MKKILDMILVLIGFIIFSVMLCLAHWSFWTNRGSEVFWMLNAFLFLALTWRIAYRRGWDEL
jgi:hypothetical protein